MTSQNGAFSIFPNFLTIISTPICFRTPFRSLLRFLPLLIHKNPLFFCFGFSYSQSFHRSTVQWKLAARCNAAFTSSLSCCLVSALASAFNPHSSNAPSFASSSAVSLPSVTNFSKCDMFSFLRAVRLYMLHFQQNAPFCQTM